jgi:hypothetical protein
MTNTETEGLKEDAPCTASILIYGPSKVGKSTLAASGPTPVLILDAEIRTKFLPFPKVIWSNPHEPPPEPDGTWDICVVYVREFRMVEQVFGWLHSGKHPFNSVVVDSISEIQQRAVDQIAGVNQMTTPNWGELLRKVSAMARGFRDLQAHPIRPLECVTFTAMERVTQEGRHVPYLQGAIANVLAYYIDIVGYYGVREDDTGGTIRKLLTSPHPSFLAGDGTGRLPDVIDIPEVPGPTGAGQVLTNILRMACDLERPATPDVATFPDLASVAVPDTGEDMIGEEPPAGNGAAPQAETTTKETQT